MKIEIQLTHEPIAEKISPPPSIGVRGAWLEFRGIVRGEENGQPISALEYEAYPEMAEREIRRILESLANKHPCLAAKVIHRLGAIPVGDPAIYVGVASEHRGEAIVVLAEFMDRLKRDVPIWKRRALPPITEGDDVRSLTLPPKQSDTPHVVSYRSLDEALSEIRSRCQPQLPVHAPLEECLGRVLRETVSASTDSPDYDRSTRDGYAILQDDKSDSFTIVDTLHAADWKPRPLKIGEAVRIATGATLPCKDLRVVMQENVERSGERIRIIQRDSLLNIRKQGEEMKAGQPLLMPGTRLNAGRLALLASVGCVQPMVCPRLRVVHFTTGDEVIPPDQTPKPGQIRNSNSTLIHGLLQQFPCDLTQHHLPENFEAARQLLLTLNAQRSTFNVLLISGGASVGEKDFTRAFLEWLGFEIIFLQVNVRPGRPLIFGQDRSRIAFGLPGNPLSHFVCFHLFVAAALAKLVGEEPKRFLRGQLATKLSDVPNPRETLWPAHLDSRGLHPLVWASSGDLTCLAKTNALIRVPVNRGSIEADKEVDFLPT